MKGHFRRTKKAKSRDRRRDASRDAFDFRDLIYRPSLLELPDELSPDWELLTILDQGDEGACAGFALAAFINYLLAHKAKRPLERSETVSARMLFNMARRYDQWKGTNTDWSSTRGAMKGWYRHGVCAEEHWPNAPAASGDQLTPERQNDALSRPLGAYYRVLPRRTDVHAALRETGVVYVAADTHDGWDKTKGKSAIPYKSGDANGGGHAFAIVGYNKDGFLVQNSWGDEWGGFAAGGKKQRGVALWDYEDFDRNVWDLWVARTGIAVKSLSTLRSTYVPAAAGSRRETAGPPVHEIAGHYVHIDDGQYDPKGEYATEKAAVDRICTDLVQSGAAHLLLFAHGGLNTVGGCATRVGKWRPVFEDNGIAELHFIWETGFFAELRDVLLGKESFAKERVAGISSWWDDWVEKISQPVGHPLWQEMRTDAEIAFTRDREAAGTHFIGTLISKLKAAGQKAPVIHLVCHSAGSIWMGHLLERWAALGGPAIEQLILFAPACTMGFFGETIAPAVRAGKLGRLIHVRLDDERERDDDVAKVYRKSLLYLVSRSFQDKNSVVPLMGMEMFQGHLDQKISAAGISGKYKEYNTQDNVAVSDAQSHGGFDNDIVTMNSMLKWVLGKNPARKFDEESLKGY